MNVLPSVTNKYLTKLRNKMVDITNVWLNNKEIKDTDINDTYFLVKYSCKRDNIFSFEYPQNSCFMLFVNYCKKIYQSFGIGGGSENKINKLITIFRYLDIYFENIHNLFPVIEEEILDQIMNKEINSVISISDLLQRFGYHIDISKKLSKQPVKFSLRYVAENIKRDPLWMIYYYEVSNIKIGRDIC